MFPVWRAGLKFMVRLRDPFFLVHITILWHQVSGVPKGTCSSTPRRTTLSRPALTSSCQLIGMLIGVWQGLGTAVGSILSESGGPCHHRERLVLTHIECTC